MTKSDNWKEHFRNHRHLLVALELRGLRQSREVRCLGDEQVVLLGGASDGARESRRVPREHEILSVVITPVGGNSVEELVSEAREQYPGAEFSGFGSDNLDLRGVLLGQVASGFEKAASLDEPGPPVVAALKYSPELEPDALLQACEWAAGIPNLRSVVPLPLSAGDRIPLPGSTTSGPVDMMVLSVLRHFLPQTIRVRASWAALGWKVAQMGLLYGADELSGWSAAECAAYSARVRAAARVESDEVKLGVEEAGRLWAPWLAKERVGGK